MARICVLTDDLLFGSRLSGDLGGVGHEVALSTVPDPACELIVADLTHAAAARLASLVALGGARPPILAFYSHVENDVRVRAEAAGLELVVPRSRIAREAAALAARLLAV